MEAAKLERAAEDQRNREAGNPGDVDFQRMIRKYRENDAPAEQPHYPPGIHNCFYRMLHENFISFVTFFIVQVKPRFVFVYVNVPFHQKK